MAILKGGHVNIMGTKLTSEKKRNDKIRNRKQRSRYYSIGFSLVYLLLSIMLIVQILMFDVLPVKYLIPLIIVLLLITIGLMYIQLKRRMARVTMLLGRVIILILSVGLCFVNFYIFKTNSGLNRIANNKNMITISVVVNKDSKATDLKDLAKADFGRSQSGTQQYIVKALADVQYETGKDIVPTPEKSIQTLIQKLNDGKIDAIILEENMRSLYTDATPEFTDNTKVIWTKSYEKEEEDNEKSVAVTEEPFNVYISGIDTYGEVDTSGRSDVNMIVTVNPKTNQVLMTNIPRDYYIPQSCQAGASDKLTHTGIFGVDCTVSSVEEYFGVPINYYLKVNYSGVTNILTAIGDIEIDNPIEFTGGEGNYHFAVGKLKLNAQQALSYARERQSFLSSDAIRIQNQSRVLTGVINKVISPSIVVRYAGLIDALSDSFQTNMGRSEINALVKMQISDMPGWNISSLSVTGEDAEKFSAANGFNSFVLDPNVKSVKQAKKIIDLVSKGEDATNAIKKYKETNFVDEEVLDPNFYKDRDDLGERSDVELAD